MIADIVVLLFVAVVMVRGYLRGLISQIATIGAGLALWLLFDSWFPPVDNWLSGVHEVFAQFETLRRIVAFSGAYFGIVLVVAALEHILIERVGLLRAGNTWLGAALGLAQGIVYVVVAVWLIQVVVGGADAVSDEVKSPWMSESVVFTQLALWNPVRVVSAREVLERTGAEEWGRRTWAQLAQDPTVRQLLEARGVSIISPSAGSDSKGDEEQGPASEKAQSVEERATASEEAPPPR